MEGIDLSPCSTASSRAERRDFHYGGMYNRFFIRTDDWVLIGDNRGKERTLYDLRHDPHEFFDVVTEHPDVSEELYQHGAGGGRRAAAVLRVRSQQAIAATPATHRAPRRPKRPAVDPLVQEHGGQQRGDDHARLPHGGHRRGVGAAGARRAPEPYAPTMQRAGEERARAQLGAQLRAAAASSERGGVDRRRRREQQEQVGGRARRGRRPRRRPACRRRSSTRDGQPEEQVAPRVDAAAVSAAAQPTRNTPADTREHAGHLRAPTRPRPGPAAPNDQHQHRGHPARHRVDDADLAAPVGAREQREVRDVEDHRGGGEGQRGVARRLP